jgi:hypothetical protein
LLGQTKTQLGGRLTKNQQLKFFLTTSAPALIQPEEADRFIDYVVDESHLFKLAAVERMETNEKDIRFVDISGGILRQMACGSGAGQAQTHNATGSVDISNTNKCLRTVSLDAKVFLCDTDLEDNITGAQFETQVMRMIADQSANELEIWAQMANAAGPVYNHPDVDNTVMHLRDGWYRQLQFGNILNGGLISGDADRTMSYRKLRCLLRALPTKYRTNPAALRIFMASDIWYDFAELQQNRETPGGDEALAREPYSTFMLTPIDPVPLLPTDISVCGCGSVPGGGGSYMFATEPKNLVLGIERNMTFERERWGTNHLTWLIWTIRVDTLVLNEDATSLMDCMQLSECATGVCAPTALDGKCSSCLDLGSGGEPA